MSFEMYQETILDHDAHPYHRGVLVQPTLDDRDLNPRCGDVVRLQAGVDDRGCLTEAYL